MRFIIIFGITLFLTLFIIFYNPYLGIFKDSVTIEYEDYNYENYKWTYDIDGDCLEIIEEGNSKWVFVPKSNGTVKLIFYYTYEYDVKYKIIYNFKVKKNKIFWLDGEGYGLLFYPNPY